MADRTSISVTEDLKAELDGLKDHEQQSYENLLWQLIDENSHTQAGKETGLDESEIVEDLKNELSMVNEPAVEVDLGPVLDKLNTMEKQLERLQR